MQDLEWSRLSGASSRNYNWTPQQKSFIDVPFNIFFFFQINFHNQDIRNEHHIFINTDTFLHEFSADLNTINQNNFLPKLSHLQKLTEAMKPNLVWNCQQLNPCFKVLRKSTSHIQQLYITPAEKISFKILICFLGSVALHIPLNWSKKKLVTFSNNKLED